MKIFKIENFKNNPNISSTIDLDDRLFNFTIKWNDYAQCAFLWLYDADMNPITLGRALVNNLLIRTDRRLLPQDLRFAHINSNFSAISAETGETYEPTLDNIGEEFAFFYGS